MAKNLYINVSICSACPFNDYDEDYDINECIIDESVEIEDGFIDYIPRDCPLKEADNIIVRINPTIAEVL